MWRELYLQAIRLALFFVLFGICINVIPAMVNTKLLGEEALVLTVVMLTIAHAWLYTRTYQKYGLMYILLIRVVAGTVMSTAIIIVLFRLLSDALLMIRGYGWNIPHSTIDFMSDGIMVAITFAFTASIALVLVAVGVIFVKLDKKMSA